MVDQLSQLYTFVDFSWWHHSSFRCWSHFQFELWFTGEIWLLELGFSHIQSHSSSFYFISSIFCYIWFCSYWPKLASCYWVYQDLHCLPTTSTWDAYFMDIGCLFVESHILYLGDIIDCIHHLFGGDNSSWVFIREFSIPPIHSLCDHSLYVVIGG